MIVALPELAALAALAACMFLVALYYAYGYSLGAVLVLLAAMFRRLTVNLWLVGKVGFGFIGDGIESLDHAIRRSIGAGIHWTRAGYHYFWHYAAYLLERTAAIVEELTGHTYRGLVYLRHHVIPTMIHAATHAIWHRLAWLEAQIATLPHRASVVIERPLKIVKTEITRVERAAVAIPLPRIGRLERDYAAIKARLRSLERLGVGAAVGVVAAAVLGRLGLGWARCSKVSRLGKHVCGLDEGLLEELLAGSLVLAGTLSLVDFAEELRGVVGEVSGEVRHFWRADVKPGAGERELGRAA